MNTQSNANHVFLELTDVVKRYGTFTALKSFSLTVEKGQAIALIGPSGSGKSTVLRCINALEKISSGKIRIGDELIGVRETRSGMKPLSETAIARQRENVGMVFQSFNLFPHQTALENVASGPRYVLGKGWDEAREKAQMLLAKVGLAEKANNYPRQLSGGQQQRVAIARALAMEPKMMLFDEPTSALDPETVQEVLSVIREVRNSGMTMLIATHEMEFARNASDKTIFMEAGEAVETGLSSQVLYEPQSTRCQAFLSNFLGRH